MTGATLAQPHPFAGTFESVTVSQTGADWYADKQTEYAAMQMSASVKRTCSALNKRGERCQARAIEHGLCAVHSGKVDPAEIGRKGGSRSPVTRLRKAADDGLRDLARSTLERALKGEAIERQQLDAARSLFAFRAAAPPASQPQGEQRAGAGHVDLYDIVQVAAEARFFSKDGVLDADVERGLFERLAARPQREQATQEAREAMSMETPPAVKENARAPASGCPQPSATKNDPEVPALDALTPDALEPYREFDDKS